MQISGMINIQQPVGNTGGQAVSNEAPFAGLSAGDTAYAQVVSVEGKEATLKTPDGQEIRAQLPEGVSMRAGDVVEMTMVSKDNGTVYLKLNTINGQTVRLEASELQVFLMDRGLPPSQVNEAATQLLLRYQVEPTPERIGLLLRTAESLPELPASVAVLMAANNIPATRENAEILMRWCQDPAALGRDIEEVGRMIRQESDAQNFAAVFRDAALGQATPKQEGMLRGAAFENLARQLGGQGMDEAKAFAAISNFVENLQLGPEERQAVQQALMTAFSQARSAGDAKQPAAAANEGTQTGVSSRVDVTRQGSEEGQVKASARMDTGAAVEKMDAQPAEQKNAMPTGMQPPAAEGRMAAEEAGAQAAKLAELLGRFFARVKGGDISADAKTLEQALKGQQSLAETVKSGVARLMGDASPAAQKASDLGAQVRLGNQMEQFYYCQIPFETRQQKGTAELYVFERRHARPVDESEGVTVLIGLDTQYMGRVETVLRSQQENLSVEFRVESERVERYLSGAMGEFEEEMKQGGFPLSGVRVTRMEERVTPLNALRVMEREEQVRITGIDIEI